jgi:hypothetical protein
MATSTKLPAIGFQTSAPSTSQWIQALFAPTSIAPLVVFRVAFGLLMLAGILRFIGNNWIETLYLQPEFHFKYLGFEWVQVASDVGMYVVFLAMAAATLLITLGLCYRISMVLFFVLFTYVELLDKALYLNHYYFISILSFLLIFLPLHRAFSLDAWFRPRLRTNTVPRWTVGAIRLQLGMVYFFAGLAKLNPDWMFHALPLRIWLPPHSAFPLLGALFVQPWFAFAMSWGGALYDLTIPFALSLRRLRPFAYIAVIGFHIMTALLFNIGMFPWVMIACTLIFFDERDFRWLYNVGRRIVRLAPTTPESQMPTPKRLRKRQRVLVAGFAVYFVIQALLPFRHLLYPGDTNWTQEGFRFAWRVMLVESAGYTTFFVRDPVTEREWVVDPERYLTSTQVRQMAFQPDMILEFAHHLERRFRDNGYNEVEVRVEAYVAYNGRSSQLLIDPEVDLTQYPPSIWAKPWILTDNP